MRTRSAEAVDSNSHRDSGKATPLRSEKMLFLFFLLLSRFEPEKEILSSHETSRATRRFHSHVVKKKQKTQKNTQKKKFK